MLHLTFSMEAIEYFLLVFTRISCFVFVAPFFGMSNTPKRVKIVLSFFTAVIIFQVIPDKNLPSYGTVWGYGALVLKEGIVGLIIGFGGQMCTMITSFAGRLVDTEIGMAMASQFDPMTKQDSTLSGMIYQYTVMLILIISGMHEYLLRALVETYTLIPVGKAILGADKFLQTMLVFLSDFVIIGFRIALPIFIVTTLLNCILGILAKVSPQMNMFAVGMQLKVITGLTVLFITTEIMPFVSDFIFQEMKKITVSFVEGMM